MEAAIEDYPDPGFSHCFTHLIILPFALPDAQVEALKASVSAAIADAGAMDHEVNIYINQQGRHWIYNTFAEWNGDNPSAVSDAIHAALPREIPEPVVAQPTVEPMYPSRNIER